MRKALFAAFWLALPASCGLHAQAAAPPATAAQAQSQALARLAEDYWETRMRLSPLWATFVRHPRYHDRLDDLSAKGRALEEAELTRLRRRLQAVDRSRLSAGDKVTWDVMALEIDTELEGERHKFWQWGVDHMDGPQSTIPTTIEVSQPMATEADAEALLKRMAALPRHFADLAANLKEGEREGRVAARLAVERTIRQLEEMLQVPAEKTSYAAAARKLPEALRAKYEPLVLAAVKEKAFPAYSKYLEFLRGYRAKARPDDKPGLSWLPGGAEAYRWAIRHYTTLDLDPEEIHRVGLSELDGIRAEMRAIARRMGHEGELDAFLDKVRSDPGNFFKERAEIVADAERLVARTKEKLPEFFGVLPKTELVVRPIEDYRERNAAGAEYWQPPEDFSRPGIYYINTYEPKTRARFSMTSLAAHEGLPGHHLQIALAMENKGLPTFRRHGGFGSFVEGWALYAERLGEEMGLYRDDLSRLGMLSDQALRACRLVVDTGLHAKGWSRRKAADFMKANTPMAEGEILDEVDRYVVWPGQALGYMLGKREIMALRRESKERLKERFDLRAFHDAVLANGAVPLPILRKAVLGEL